MRPVLVLALVLVVAPFASAQDDPLQWGRGIFEVRDPFVLGQIRQTPLARSPRTLEPLEVELGGRAVWENSYGLADDDRLTPFSSKPTHRLTIDAETRTLDLVARMGILPRIELGAELRALEWCGGGLLDGMIEKFHHIYGFGTLRRDERPRNGYLVAGTENGGREVELPGQLTGIGDGRVSARVLALRGGDYWPAVSVTVELFVPFANRHLGHEHRPAETLSIDLSKRILDLPIVIYAGGAWTHDEQTQIDDIHVPNSRFMYYFGIEWEVLPPVSLTVHFWQETQRERELYRHTDLPYFNAVQYIAFGIKIEPVHGVRIELGALENVIDPNTTGDFGFLANVFVDLDFASHAALPGEPP